MQKEIVVPEDMAHLVERFNYSPAVKVGSLIYCSGQVGRDSQMNVIDSSLEDHFVAAWENLGAVLRAGGSDFEHIVEMTTYHVGLQNHLPLFLDVRSRYTPRTDVPTAWSAIGVTELTFPGQLVELKAVALVP